MRVIFHPEFLQFEGYPFKPASISQGGPLPLTQIRDVDVSATPPQIRTHQGETLFVSAMQRDELQKVVDTARLPTIKRYDVWADVLEPYLDTEFTAAAQRRTLDSLNAHGFPEPEVAQIRRRVERRMMAYNFGVPLWEWVYLGLFDVLSAFQPRSPLREWIDPRVRRFRQFYRDAMRIAERGREGSGTPSF